MSPQQSCCLPAIEPGGPEGDSAQTGIKHAMQLQHACYKLTSGWAHFHAAVREALQAQPQASALAKLMQLTSVCRRDDSWLRLSLYSTRHARQGTRSSAGAKNGELDGAKLPQLTFAPQDALGSSPHARQHAAFVAKRTGPFFLSPRHALSLLLCKSQACYMHHMVTCSLYGTSMADVVHAMGLMRACCQAPHCCA